MYSDCVLFKITKQSFNIKSHRASKVFEQIHLDLIGPIIPQSKIGSRFILTLVNNYSGYIARFPITADCEFTGSRLVAYLDKNHIRRLKSEPYHPEHNGRAERANRTVVEAMQATFRSSSVPKTYWHELVKSCCFSLNQIPRKDHQNSPWELVHGYSIPATYLKPLGTQTVTLTMKRVQGKKFESKGAEGLFIGYNVLLRSHRVLLKSGALIKSKHVRFLRSSDSKVAISDDVDFMPEEESASNTQTQGFSSTVKENAPEDQPLVNEGACDTSTDHINNLLVPNSENESTVFTTTMNQTHLN
ncbi:uncharacterized protein VP01_1877g6 [Puccinia sorghi]|uniref:Integrase catalytic domain-containing protein n=1 Tax=Puccinia sorghi TaxID=27349 RepID=A0A0L6VD90_9BASI|nr:uncharacterized protein VP01_1877g6 [Puccinia sorghi]